MTVLDDNLEFDVIEYIRVSILSIDNPVTPQKKTLDVSSVGYDIDIIDGTKENEDNNITNSYLVNVDLLFPVNVVYYNPSNIVEPFNEYEFELITYFDSSILKNNSITKNMATEDDILVESGTIKLTLPDIDEENKILILDAVIVELVISENKNNLSLDKTVTGETFIDDTEHQKYIDILITKDNPKLNSSLVTSLVLILIVVAAILAYLDLIKRNSVICGVFGKDTKKSDNTRQITKTISFDDSITLDITNILD